MFSTDYLVICGRASAHSLDAAGATLESLLDSSKHIIAQLLRPAQRSLMQKFQPRHLLFINPSSERERLVTSTMNVRMRELVLCLRCRSVQIYLERVQPVASAVIERWDPTLP